jgi:hypothetical protein
MSMPFLLAVSIDLLSGGFPSCQLMVPAESTSQGRFRPEISCRAMPSANGDRQIFPKHTIKIFMGLNITN